MVQFVLMNIIEQICNQSTKDLTNHLMFDHREVIPVVIVRNRKAKSKQDFLDYLYNKIPTLSIFILIVGHAACLAYSKFDNLSCPVRVINKCFNSIAQ